MSISVDTHTETVVDTISCSRCADVVPLEDTVYIGDDYICAECADNYTVMCHSCNTRIWTDDDYGDSTISLCSHCRENHTTCEACSMLLERDNACYGEDDDYPYCRECYNQLEQRIIHSYSYKPEPVFYGRPPKESGRFFGIELEVDDGGKDSDNAETVLSILNAEKELVYAKSDGSLDDGFELVSHPCNLRYHTQNVPWEAALDALRRMGYRSHMCGTAGLHIHVNRDSFGDTVEMQESNIACVLYLVERFWEEMLRFSRRTESQIRKWAARYGYKQSGREILEVAKSYYPARYTAINLTNRNTVEFRIFRGTLRYNTFIATLQFVDEICRVACCLSEAEIQAMSWADFMLGLPKEKMPELIQYLKERRLYINDPVENNTEEEQ